MDELPGKTRSAFRELLYSPDPGHKTAKITYDLCTNEAVFFSRQAHISRTGWYNGAAVVKLKTTVLLG